MPLSVTDILHECRLFSAVKPEGFARLVAIAHLQNIAKAEIVFREGEPCPGVFIVGRGLVRVFKTGAGGKEHVLHMVSPGNTFAEVAAVGGFECPASAEAVEPTVCAVLPSDRFRRLLQDDHELCLALMSGMSLWVRHLVGLMEDVVLRDAAGRLARYLLDTDRADDGTIALPGLKRHVASHLNLTSETFSRTLRRLVEAGLVDQPDNTRIRVLQPDQLRQVANGLFPRV